MGKPGVLLSVVSHLAITLGAAQRALKHVVSLSCANKPLACASYDVLVHQLAASLRPILADKPLQFASS